MLENGCSECLLAEDGRFKHRLTQTWALSPRGHDAHFFVLLRRVHVRGKVLSVLAGTSKKVCFWRGVTGLDRSLYIQGLVARPTMTYFSL